MTRLSVGGWNRYYLCFECERVREETGRKDGTIAGVRYHDLASKTLSRAAREQAEAMLRLRGYEQGSLFMDEDMPP